jgi:hypothetical protein
LSGFFYRVDAKAAGSTVGLEHHAVALAGAHETQSTLTFTQLAGTRTDIALDAAVAEDMPVAGGMRVAGSLIDVFHALEPGGKQL